MLAKHLLPPKPTSKPQSSQSVRNRKTKQNKAKTHTKLSTAKKMKFSSFIFGAFVLCFAEVAASEKQRLRGVSVERRAQDKFVLNPQRCMDGPPPPSTPCPANQHHAWDFDSCSWTSCVEKPNPVMGGGPVALGAQAGTGGTGGSGTGGSQDPPPAQPAQQPDRPPRDPIHVFPGNTNPPPVGEQQQPDSVPGDGAGTGKPYNINPTFKPMEGGQNVEVRVHYDIDYEGVFWELLQEDPDAPSLSATSQNGAKMSVVAWSNFGAAKKEGLLTVPIPGLDPSKDYAMLMVNKNTNKRKDCTELIEVVDVTDAAAESVAFAQKECFTGVVLKDFTL